MTKEAYIAIPDSDERTYRSKATAGNTTAIQTRKRPIRETKVAVQTEYTKDQKSLLERES